MNKQSFMHNKYTKYLKLAAGFLFTLLACVYAETLHAQTYPVQANVYIMPPYGKHLNDYYTTSKEKLVVSLLNRDQQKPVLEVRLRMSITASNGLKLQSKEEIDYPAITLDANIPTRLTQDDLAPYFRHINAQGYLDRGKLPDGMVEFTFQVIEKYTGKVLSAPATGRVWLSTQKPPVLRLPSQDESIGFRDPMNLKFQWEPQHKNLSQVEYEFELRELPDNGAAPQSAFMYAPVIHQQRQLHTYLIYDVMMPPLDPGKRYGWRVRAIAKDGVDELNMFENNGYSEIFRFHTQDNCLPPAALSVSLQNRRLDMKWLPEAGNNEFVIQYRPKYGTSETWQEVNTYDAQTSIYDMQRGTVYEYRVGAICTTGKPVFTNTGEITIPAIDSARLANCGVPPQLDLENKERLPELKVGDRVMLSDYPMTVTKVSGAGGNFSGEGWVPVNWLLETKWAVEFSNITVNTDYKLIAGSVRAQYDATEGNIADMDHITEGGTDNTRGGIIRPDISFDFSIPENPVFSHNEEKGELIVYDTSGNQQRVELPKNNEGKVVFPVTVKDRDGNIHKVDVPRDENGNPAVDKDKDGNPVKDENGNLNLESTYLGKQGDPLPEDSFDRKNISRDVAVVTFEKGAGVYAFDTWLDIYREISKIGQKYDHLAKGGEQYHVPWKLVPAGKTDVVEAIIDINKNYRDNKNKPLEPKDVIFATPQGTRLEASFDGRNKYTVSLIPGAERDVQEIYALYPVNGSSEKFYTLGRLNVIGYPEQTHKLTVVQVSGNRIAEQALKDKLKEVYAPLGITWEVSFDDFDYKGDVGRFFNGESRLLSAYNDRMKAMQEAYKAYRGGLEAETSYLFVMDDSGDGKNRDTQGFMPQGRQFGYIFLKNIRDGREDVNQVIAHELGHGRWKLSHTFDGTYGGKIAREDKLNLMSYGGGTHLAKWQWNVMDMPAWFANPLDGDDKGMSIQETEPSLQINNPGDEISFYIGVRKYTFIFKEKVQNLTNSQFDFDNKTYAVASYVKDGTFAGFYEKTGYNKLQDKDSKVDLSSNAAKSLQQFNAYELKAIEELSIRSAELKNALIENNNYEKVKAIVVLSQAIGNDEYLSAFSAAGKDNDCRIELGTKKAYTDNCLDRYIEALAGALNKDVEYFDWNCNCIVKRSADELLGNSDSDFRKWFTDSIGGADAIRLLENRIYEKNIVRYMDNIAKGIYGADEFGTVNIPQSIKEKVRKEARESAFPAIKAMWAIERSGADPDGLLFKFSPVSFDRFSYYYYRALATTSQEDAKEILTDVGLQVAIQWAFEVIPAIKTAKGNLAKWMETKVKPADLISEIESKGYYITDGNGEAIILRNASNQEGKVSITARNLDNVQWVDDAVRDRVLYSVDKSFQAGDEAAEVFINGKYKLNPTSTTIDELTINPSGTVKGKKWLQKEQTTEELLNGTEYMYVIDENNRLRIGTRAQHVSNFSKPAGKAPHPTLIGGADPKVQAAGTIEFRGGKIYKVDNASGHYKPSVESLGKAEEIFRRDFPVKSFTNDFKGFIQYGD